MPHIPPAAPGDVTRLLESVRAGDQAALDRLFGLLYDELRRIVALGEALRWTRGGGVARHA